VATLLTFIFTRATAQRRNAGFELVEMAERLALFRFKYSEVPQQVLLGVVQISSHFNKGKRRVIRAPWLDPMSR